MKYYCSTCKTSIFITDGKELVSDSLGFIQCPHCMNRTIFSFPYHETVQQWETRTGSEYNDSAPVYWSYSGERHWGVDSYNYYKHLSTTHPDDNRTVAFVATDLGAPSLDLIPKGDKE